MSDSNRLLVEDWAARLSSVEVQTSDFIFFDGSNRRKKFMSKSQLLSSAARFLISRIVSNS